MLTDTSKNGLPESACKPQAAVKRGGWHFRDGPEAVESCYSQLLKCGILRLIAELRPPPDLSPA
jgi:hypothetical protein